MRSHKASHKARREQHYWALHTCERVCSNWDILYFKEQTMAVNIRINGVLTGYPEGSTVSDVVARLALMSRRVAVTCNGKAVPIPKFASTLLSDDDALEVSHLAPSAE